jgi:hypothetical protein
MSAEHADLTPSAEDDLVYLDDLPDPQPGLSEAELRGCRWISG